MKKAMNWLKNIRPLKVLTVFLAGIFLFMAQACGAPGVASQPPQPGAQAPNTERYDATKDYPLNSPTGGINNFSDVDPRAGDEKAVNDKAEALVKNAQKNIDNKSASNPGEYIRNFKEGTPLGQRGKNLGDDIGNSVNELREGVVKGTQRGIENIKGNTQNAAEDVTKNVQRGAEDAGKNVKRTADDAGNAVKRAVD
ncbi:hypothetical protein [Nostoc sp. ChiQUE01b]|uniref:hypothetical protein n=1 Tax=Nostoc sp. ChiQUE01b TaxID=3075376 RepID=UPI002AD24340|nr:hypothetical protein [Nostoc sp. ChiQUE01b]MDZ8261593.1 hypothetical protein [Nostoc sp. ChiQUE01b]